MLDEKQVVFTVREVVLRGALVQYVHHDEDNDWQFLPDKEVSVDDMMLISLKQMLDHDETLIRVLDIPTGYKAYRKTKNDHWEIMKSNT